MPAVREPSRSCQARALRRAATGAALLTSLCAAPPALSAITFSFDYTGNTPGIGFLDPVLGATRQAALQTAADQFSSMFGSHFGNSGTVLLQVSSSVADNSSLASAGSYIVGMGTPGFGLGEVVRNKLVAGADLNGADADATVDVNFFHNWQLGYGNAVLPGEFDFYGVLYHEFTHALGFSSSISQAGDPYFGSRSAGEWAKYDQFLVGLDSMKVVGPSPGSPPLGATELFQFNWDVSSVGGASGGEFQQGLYFDGPATRAANGGNAVGLYTPETWSDGSSVSHLDTDNPALAGMMMLHAVSTGAAARNYSAIEVGMLTDLGYTPMVPEPGTWLLLLLGVGVVGWSGRRGGAPSSPPTMRRWPPLPPSPATSAPA